MRITTATSPRTSPAEYHLVKEIRQALGLPDHGTLRADESPTCLSAWSVRELQDIYARNGGTVTARPVIRGLSDGSTYGVTELVLTVDLGDLGPVVIVTDWDPTDEAHGWGLPIVQAVTGRCGDAECPTCGAPAIGTTIPEHRPGSPCTVDYRAV